MPSMDELYQNVILEHNRSPRNYRVMDDASGRAEGNNPLCGDRITVWLKVRDGVIEDASFQGAGCAIDQISDPLQGQIFEIRGQVRGFADAFQDWPDSPGARSSCRAARRAARK